MKRDLIVLLGMLLSVALISFSGEKKEFKIPYEKYALSNGMDVILHVDHSNPIVAVYIVYHVGSAREEKGKTGFAHLFEHLRFNESQDVPQGEWFKKLQGAGATLINGSTSNDRTNYFETIPKNALEMALWMESDRMGFLLSKFTPLTFTTQQNVVQNEKRRSDNRPFSQSGVVVDKMMYPDTHPYNWDVIGSLDDLSNAKIQDAVDFHNKFYGPSNATLVVAGDIDVAHTKKLIDKYFAEIPSSPKPKLLDKMPVKLTETKRALYEDNLANAPMLTMTFPTVEEYNKDAYALQFLARIMSVRKSALYKILVEEKKLAPAGGGGGFGGFGRGGFGGGSSVSASQRSREVAGAFQITVRAFPTVKLGDVEDAIKESFARFEKEGFSDKDVERQKAGQEFRFYNTIGSISGKARTLGDFNMDAGSPDFMATDLKNAMSVTKDDVWRVYNKYIKGQNYVLVSTVPSGKTDLAAPSSAAFVLPEESLDKAGSKKDVGTYNPAPIPSKIDRTKEPVKGPDPSVKVPAIWTGKTSNGIQMFGIKKSDLPLAEFSIIIKGGMLLDPPGKTGTGSLMARLLNEGTKSKTPIELREAIEDLGANVNMSGSEESITLSGSCLSSKLKEVFALAKEMLFEPRWDEKEFGLSKTQVIESLKRSENTPSAMASSVFDKLIYGSDNLLAKPATGTQKTVEAISLDDLKAYYNKNLSPSMAKIMVLGDISKEDAIKLFDGLKEWKAKEVKLPKIKISEPAKPGVYFIDVPKAKQSVFNVGHIGPAASDPNFYKVTVMNYKLGGDFSSILNMILREAKSFTYGARSGFSGNSHPGSFKATVDVQTNATFETAQILRDEITKYRQGISADDLNLVKSTLLKSNAGRFETLQQLGGMLSPIVTFGLPSNYIKQRETFVQKLTLDQQKALAKKYLQPGKLVFVIVGDKETQFDKLKELGLGEPILLDKDAKPVKK
ncbi:MAG: pitrilysin family protein [Ignavibacteriales bacterium]|nr:pitrilysin family protein [Ignavibacteriales bacterium]